jgi:hypothetical protein
MEAVTGVQTCALPISTPPRRSCAIAGILEPLVYASCAVQMSAVQMDAAQRVS